MRKLNNKGQMASAILISLLIMIVICVVVVTNGKVYKEECSKKCLNIGATFVEYDIHSYAGTQCWCKRGNEYILAGG